MPGPAAIPVIFSLANSLFGGGGTRPLPDEAKRLYQYNALTPSRLGVGLPGGTARPNFTRTVATAEDPARSTPPTTDFSGLEGQAHGLALQNLMDLLTGGPNQQLFNQQLTGIARGGQQTQQLIRDIAARSGPGVGAQSGVTQALQAAAAQGTQGQLAQARAQQTEDERRRQFEAIQLFIDLVLGPQIQREGIESGVSIAGRQAAAQERGAQISAASNFIVGLMDAFSSGGGGGGQRV